MQGSTIGVVPLGVLQLSREALEALCEERHNELFASDIFCELRMPTLLQHLGFPIHSAEALKHVSWEKQPYPWLGRGIFHPVKKSSYFGGITRLPRRWFDRG